MGEQILPQVRDDPLARLLQDDRLEIRADHRKHQHAGVYRHRGKQAAEGEVPHQHLLHIAHDEGRHDIVDDGEQHQQARHYKAAQIGPGVMGQPPDDLAVRDVALKAHGSLFVLDQGVGQDQQRRHAADQAARQPKRIQLDH